MEEEINDILERSFKCPFCTKYFSRHFNLKRHLKNIHNVCVKKEGEVFIEFDSFEEFLKWKETEEKATKSNYVKHCGSITKKNGDVVSIYHCNRGGIYRPKGYGIKSLKSQGSSKIGTTCPARIKVTSSDGKAVVHYYPKHQFHDTQSEHLRFSYSDRAGIAEKLRKGISVVKILEDFNEEVTIGCGRKILTVRDIFNIKRDFNIKDPDPVSEEESDKKVSIIMEEPNGQPPLVVTFKDISNITRDFILNNSISHAENSVVKVTKHVVEHPTVIKVSPILTTKKEFSIRDTVSSDESDTEEKDEQPEELPASEKNNSVIKRKMENILAILDDCALTAEKRNVICEKLDSIFNLCWVDFVKNPAMFLYPD